MSLKIPKLSIPLMLMVLIPTIGGILMFALVLIGFETARGVAVEEQEKETQQLVNTAASSIEELWIAPRNKTAKALSESETLLKRIRGEVSFDRLFREWEISTRVLESYFFIYYGLTDGTIEYYPDGDLPEGYDPRKRPWYEAGVAIDEGVAWTSPYEEAITNEMVVSTVSPIHLDGEKVGVLSTDMRFEGLARILEEMQLPSGSSVFLVNETGEPFIGTDDGYAESGYLPQSDENFFVGSSKPMSNGWRVKVIVPRLALAESFSQLRKPIIAVSSIILLVGVAIVSLLVGRSASRIYRLANYFREVLDGSMTPRDLFSGKDEISYLNRQFNYVINEARKAEEKKLAQERTFRFLIEQAPVGFFRTNRNGALLYINLHAAALVGYTQDEALEQVSSVAQFYYDKRDRDRFLEELNEHGEVRNRKILFETKSGEKIWISMTARINRNESESDQEDGAEIEGFIMDITSDVEERNSLINMTESDPLTGAANRRAFDNAARTVVEHARLSGLKVTLVLFDIDKFKTINDAHGHDVGDYLLKELVSIVKKHVREADLFARIGGDEFAILLPPGSGKEEACGLMNRLRDEVKSMPLPDELSEPPTLSIGIGIIQGDQVQVPDLYKTADTAMYRAKEAGRNRMECIIEGEDV